MPVARKVWLQMASGRPTALARRLIIHQASMRCIGREVKRRCRPLRWRLPGTVDRNKSRRKCSLTDEVLAEGDKLGVIDNQDGNRCTADASQPGQLGAVPGEMPSPSILAGMEQPHDPSGLGIDAGDVGTFVAVAEEAGQGQVARICRPVVLEGDNVVNGVG